MAGGIQALIWILWCGVVAGLCWLVSMGLRGSLLRSGRPRLRAWVDGMEGEVVLGDGPLRCGQSARMVQVATESASAYGASITEIGDRFLTLALEGACGHLRGGGRSGSPFSLGTAVEITVTGPQALYSFRSTVRDVRAERRSDSLLVTVRRPFWMARKQRRRAVRIATALPVTFQRAVGACTAVGKTLPALRRTLRGTVINLSGGGLRADVCGPMAPGELATLASELPRDAIVQVRLPAAPLSDLMLLARICAWERTAVRGGLGLRISCEFLPLSEYDQDRLVRYVFTQQGDPDGRGDPGERGEARRGEGRRGEGRRGEGRRGEGRSGEGRSGEGSREWS